MHRSKPGALALLPGSASLLLEANSTWQLHPWRKSLSGKHLKWLQIEHFWSLACVVVDFLVLAKKSTQKENGEIRWSRLFSCRWPSKAWVIEPWAFWEMVLDDGGGSSKLRVGTELVSKRLQGIFMDFLQSLESKGAGDQFSYHHLRM